MYVSTKIFVFSFASGSTASIMQLAAQIRCTTGLGSKCCKLVP